MDSVISALLAHHATQEPVRRRLQLEMVARSLKQLLRRAMREAVQAAGGGESAARAARGVIERVMTGEAAVWEDELPVDLGSRFGSLWQDGLEEGLWARFESVVGDVVRRACKGAGLRQEGGGAAVELEQQPSCASLSFLTLGRLVCAGSLRATMVCGRVQCAPRCWRSRPPTRARPSARPRPGLMSS